MKSINENMETLFESRLKIPAMPENIFPGNRGKFNRAVKRDWQVYWQGLVFMRGKPAGNPSIAWFLNQIEKSGVAEALQLLKGIYAVIIHHDPSGKWYAAVDASGLFQFFYDEKEQAASDSFLRLVAESGYSTADLDPEAIAEFLRYGFLFNNKTFFRTIRKLPGDAILYYTPQSATLKLLPRKLVYESEAPGNPFERFESILWDYAQSLKEYRISIDLTAGIDSRLLAVLFDRFQLPFETAISGAYPDGQEIQISRKIARQLEKPWYATIHSLQNLEKDLEDLFHITDGLHDPVYYHRLFQFQQERHQRGMNLMISGVGGELFKDYWWLQDFPFYKKKHANLENFLRYRFNGDTSVAGFFNGEFAAIFENLPDTKLRELQPYRTQGNTRTYDEICRRYLLREIGGRILTSNMFFLDCFTPYLAFEVTEIGIHLPRYLRFFNLFHRKELTRLHPELAKFPISEGGLSASFLLTDLMGDIPRYGWNRFRRLIAKFNIMQMPARPLNHPELYQTLRKLPVTGESLQMLSENHIFIKDVTLEQIPDKSLGRIIAVGRLIKFLRK